MGPLRLWSGPFRLWARWGGRCDLVVGQGAIAPASADLGRLGVDASCVRVAEAPLPADQPSAGRRRGDAYSWHMVSCAGTERPRVAGSHAGRSIGWNDPFDLLPGWRAVMDDASEPLTRPLQFRGHVPRSWPWARTVDTRRGPRRGPFSCRTPDDWSARDQSSVRSTSSRVKISMTSPLRMSS